MINYLSIRLVILLIVSISCDASPYVCDKNKVPCGCGQANVGIQARIVNGENSIPNSWPMIVSLRNSETPLAHICGGTILSESYILTAAHCVNNIATGETAQNITISAGVHNLSEPNQIIRRVDRIIVHPLWLQLRLDIQYDIAILHLAEPLDLQSNSALSRTCLPPRQNTSEEIMNYPSNGTHLVVIGWGNLVYLGKGPDILQQVTLNSINHFDKICSNTIRDPAIHFCAGLYEGGKSACHGDSGGPIFQWIGDRWEQVGIVSYGEKGCGGKGYPNVFTRISYFYDWIQSHILPDNQAITNPVLYQCSSYSEQCGCSRRNVVLSRSKILEQSEDALPHSWSMIISIQVATTKQHICSGTILENSFILTAAHCLTNRSAQDITIVAGMYYLSESDVIIRQVQRIYIHPNYTAHSNQYTNDIAILHLLQPLDAYYDNNISRTCVSSFNYQGMSDLLGLKNGTSLVITGWNITNMIKSPRPAILQQTQIYAMIDENATCSVSNGQRELQFCAGRYENNKDICYGGDYGDPIFQWNNSRWVQVGLASYCSTLGVFTNLASYSSWIKSTVISSAIQSSTSYQCDKKSSCGCGQNDVNITTSSIIGSNDAVEHSWPMVVSIQYSDTHWCLGSILSDSFILTSVTCVGIFSDRMDYLTIVAGIYNISETATVRRQVDRIYLHPNFTRGLEGLHDVAILHLDQPLSFDNISSILTKTCVPMESDFYPKPNSSLVEIGWNRIRSGEYMSGALQQMSIQSIDSRDESCLHHIDDDIYQFCVKASTTEKYIEIVDLCDKTVGGPVLMYMNNHWEQVGIISDQYRCYQSNRVKVYTRLSSYLEWIKDITNSSFTTYSPHTDWINNGTNSSFTTYQPSTKWINNVTNSSFTTYQSSTKWIENATNASPTTSTLSNNNSSIFNRQRNNFIFEILFILILMLL